MVPLKTRILLADDHTIVRQGLRFILDAEPDLEVVAEASNGHEALARALKDDIDLAILDIAMPTMTGLQAARELAARRPELRMLILSMHDDEEYLFEALKAGDRGLRPQVRRRPRPRRGVPRRDARRAVPLRRAPSARSSATTSSAPAPARRRPRTRSPRASSRSSSSSPRATRTGRSPSCS